MTKTQNAQRCYNWTFDALFTIIHRRTDQVLFVFLKMGVYKNLLNM